MESGRSCGTKLHKPCKGRLQRTGAPAPRAGPRRHLLTIALTGGPDTGKPLRLAWARAAALDGRYVLGPNAPRLDAAQRLEQSKGRDEPEKHSVKGPPGGAPGLRP